jgi:hypothetical protein
VEKIQLSVKFCLRWGDRVIFLKIKKKIVNFWIIEVFLKINYFKVVLWTFHVGREIKVLWLILFMDIGLVFRWAHIEMLPKRPSDGKMMAVCLEPSSRQRANGSHEAVKCLYIAHLLPSGFEKHFDVFR